MRSNELLRQRHDNALTQWQIFVQDSSQRFPKSAKLASSPTLLPLLQDSWQISAKSLPYSQISTSIIDPDSTHYRFTHSAYYQCAKPLLDELTGVVKDNGFAVALSDANATLQWTASNRRMASQLEKTHFIPSARWDEQSFGTNAIGVAARLLKPVTIFSAEHYVSSLHEWVCYAAPIINPRSGQAMGVLDISAPWRSATPMALTTVSHYAQKIAAHWSHLIPEPKFLLNFCGHTTDHCAGQKALPRRLQEIFLILSLHPEGLSLEALHAHLYGDSSVSMSTLKSEITHLRGHIGNILQARPYRLMYPTTHSPTDAHLIEKYLLNGDIEQAINLYQRPLLPSSKSPTISEYRDYLHQLMVQTLLKSRSINAIWTFLQKHPAEHSLLQCLLNLLPAEDSRRLAVQAKLHIL